MAERKCLFNEEDRREMAESYLIFGTFRAAEENTRFSKSTIHKVVTDFIRNGDFHDVPSLKALLEKNIKERAIRGGNASAKLKKK